MLENEDNWSVEQRQLFFEATQFIYWWTLLTYAILLIWQELLQYHGQRVSKLNACDHWGMCKLLWFAIILKHFPLVFNTYEPDVSCANLIHFSYFISKHFASLLCFVRRSNTAPIGSVILSRLAQFHGALDSIILSRLAQLNWAERLSIIEAKAQRNCAKGSVLLSLRRSNTLLIGSVILSRFAVLLVSKFWTMYVMGIWIAITC